MKILVTGATGKLGSKIVETLLKSVPASNLVVSVRNPEKAEGLRNRGVEVRQSDYDRPETLDHAYKGIDRILLISADGDNETRIQQHTNAVQAAERAGVKFIAYTSLANAAESKNLMAPPHVATEAAIIKTGIPYSLLRNNWYLENELGSIQGAIAGAPWVTSAGDGKVGWALQQDYADAAAAVLAGEGHENTVYELSGPLLTQEELASALGKVLGKEIPVQQVSDEKYAEIMTGLGLPDFVIPIVVGIQESIRNGSLEVESNDFEKILGRPVTPINEALRQLVHVISQNK
ncbi:NAD(P)H dehydrogenase (quinone) [Paenibacillus sp. UNCCL117]|uniref:SDR family oxidoreductase n=1 Tax=unclassified Paenibacillus TaxID=185978 RepID=UPI000890C705|nr:MULTISPECIES: SDR family oxidoreductase [unclassified Paenibacillus]SDC16572.1 NAD(P)H dehydrogenase (quinone) [Paenibacillus sp. cl123]SFW17814.1 NAD(P)H dehydrogenase (quinone) [Paenibacillus sp. UNCCL117]